MSKGLVTTIIAVLVIAIGGVAGWFFLTDNAEISEDVTENTEQLDAQEPTDVVFRIDPENSTAEFNIDEVLRGEDVTVVGTTNQVAGDIRVNVANPPASEVGEIRINARDLETDTSNRNRALRQFILRSSEDEYEFITFQPTSLSNVPEQAEVGTPIEFQIIGDLTITDVTNEVTFDATVTLTSDTTLEGTAETTVNYTDYNLTIPDVPFVASVEEDVILRLNFMAAAADTTSPEEEEEADTTEAEEETEEETEVAATEEAS